jgi:nucleoside-diphosphate-sugar epimerase
LKTLITGAAGFLGYHLARSLLGRELLLVDNFSRGEPDESFRRLLERPGVDFLKLDLCDPRSGRALIGEFDVCYHLAALNGTNNFYSRPWDVLRNATLPTINLLESIVRTGRCRRFVFAGSSEVYAGAILRLGWPVPTAEDAPLLVDDASNPRWSYAAGKLLGEVAVLNSCRDTPCDWSILRYHNIYGPRMGEDGHVIPDFLRRALRGSFHLYGPGQTRTFMYVDDAIYATVKLAEMPDAANQIVNVGDAVEIEIHALARDILRMLAMEHCQIDSRPAPAGSVARRAPDLQKLDQFLPDRPRTPITAGLLPTVAYYRERARAHD